MKLYGNVSLGCINQRSWRRSVFFIFIWHRLHGCSLNNLAEITLVIFLVKFFASIQTIALKSEKNSPLGLKF